jgi:hypothetical protein
VSCVGCFASSLLTLCSVVPCWGVVAHSFNLKGLKDSLYIVLSANCSLLAYSHDQA